MSHPHQCKLFLNWLLIWFNNVYLDAISQAAISNVDLTTLKSVKVMVEKLDSHSMLINCLKSNKIFNWEKTLENCLNGFQTECTSSNVNIGEKRKHSNATDLDADNNFHKKNIKENSSTDLINESKSIFYSSNKDLQIKNKRCISPTDVNNLKTQILPDQLSLHMH